MIARLAGLAVLIPAAAVGVVLAAPVAYLGMALPEWFVAPHYDWDAQAPFAVTHGEVAA